MSNEIGILFDRAQRMAKATGLKINDLEKVTGEDRAWIRKFLNNEIADPGSKRLESFIAGIKKHNVKQRNGKK